MAVKRGPDGRMIDEPTIGPEGTEPPAAPEGNDALRARYDRKTYMPGSDDGAPATGDGATGAPQRAALDPKTTIVGGAPLDGNTTGALSRMQDPVVGWLVIIGGPGQGEVLTLGYGRNTVGRGETARIRMDFGDRDISRGNHCIIDYEPRERAFSIQHGAGVNFTYLAGKALHERQGLSSGDIIEIGSTVLRFVPFCSDQWDWKSDNAGNPA